MEMNGTPGEKIKLDSANIPNPEWFPHVKLLLTFIGINLGAPFVLAMMDTSETTFHGYRGAIDMARMGFRMNQRRRVKSFYRPAWEWRLRNWLDDDAVLRRRFLSNRKPVNLFSHSWTPPSWPYIEPVKDAMGDLLREANTLTSPRRRAAERGDDYSEIVREAIEDRAGGIDLAIEAATQINEKHDLEGTEAVTWQHLYQPPMPQGVTLQLNATGEVSEAPQTPQQETSRNDGS
jgi:capsid protein